MVTRTVAARKKAFRVALAKAGKNARQFARDIEVSPTHLYGVLNAERVSPRVEGAIESLIEKYAPEMAAA